MISLRCAPKLAYSVTNATASSFNESEALQYCRTYANVAFTVMRSDINTLHSVRPASYAIIACLPTARPSKKPVF